MPIRYPGNAGAPWPILVVYSGAGIAVPSTFLGTTFEAPRIVFGVGTTVYTSAFTANASTDILTAAGASGRLARTETVQFTTTGTLPAPLTAGTVYYVVPGVAEGQTTFQVSATAGGPAIDITTTGTGTHSVSLFTTDMGCPPVISRGLDSGMPTWASCNPSSGVYEWTAMDQYMTYHYWQRGRQTLFTLNQTPTWAARNAANDAYGYSGGNQVPTLLTSTSTFITALLQRYNATSVFNPGGAKMFYGIEAWNEPAFTATGTAGSSWSGTMAELAQQTRLVNQAAKAVDPSIKIFGPGFTNNLAQTTPNATSNSMYGWLIASDGATGQGKDWIDVLSFHNYDCTDMDLLKHVDKIARIQAHAQAAGLAANFPIAMTERGVATTQNPLLHIRLSAIEAALGLQLSVQFKFDTFGHNCRTNSTLRTAFFDLYSTICGKTLTYCAINQNRTVTVTANGVTKTY